MRGYCGIGLDNPKTPANIGAALRACSVFGASFMAVSGTRYERHGTNTTKTERHMPLFRTDDLRLFVPFDCVPVAVELIDTGIALPEYKHPLRAFYVFGAEDATLGDRVLSWCRDVVYIPAAHCLNLAATVNVLLYDRASKTVKDVEA